MIIVFEELGRETDQSYQLLSSLNCSKCYKFGQTEKKKYSSIKNKKQYRKKRASLLYMMRKFGDCDDVNALKL